MKYWLHPAAERDLGDAAVYYAEHASRRIASAFMSEFERRLAMLIENQGLGVPTDTGLRVLPFRRFPYSAVYRESDAGPRVYAVFHHKREPSGWRDRL